MVTLRISSEKSRHRSQRCIAEVKVDGKVETAVKSSQHQSLSYQSATGHFPDGRRLVKRHVVSGVVKDLEQTSWRADENDMPSMHDIYTYT